VAALLCAAKSLRKLGLKSNVQLTAKGIEALAAKLPSECGLRDVSIMEVGLMDEEGGEAIAKLCHKIPSLQVLDASMNSLDAVGLQALAQGLAGGGAASLQELCLDGVELGVAGTGPALAALVRQTPKLQKLGLEGNFVGAAGLNAFTRALPDHDDLREVGLQACGLWRVAGGRAAAALACKAGSLECLRLADNWDFGPSGIGAFAKGLPESARLRKVDVTLRMFPSSAPFGRAVAQLVRAAPALETLSISLVCANGLRALKQDLPEGRRIRALSLDGAELVGVAGGQLAAQVVGRLS